MRDRGSIAAGIAVIAALTLPGAAGAANITVSTGADEHDAIANPTCSLREAITSANTNAAFGGCTTGGAGQDTIFLTRGTTHQRTITGSNEQMNATGDLDIISGEPVTIQTSGVGLAVISGDTTAAGDRVIENHAAGTMIEGVEITGGRSPTSQGGGGIRNAGTLTLRNTAVVQNNASSFGGGIANSNSSTLNAINVTVAGNQSNQSGGGIDADSASTTNLNNVTISGNTVADSDNDDETGGGIFAFSNLSTVTLSNTIVDGNIDSSIPSPGASDCDTTAPPFESTYNSAGYNLIGSLTGCPVTPGTGDITGVSSQLGPLSANGGGSRTLPIQLPSSPAFNAGNNVLAPGSGGAACAATDQRGVTRPQGDRCDIGAFELTVNPPVPIGTCPPTFSASRLTCIGPPVIPKPSATRKCKKKGKKASAAAKKKGCKKPKKRK